MPLFSSLWKNHPGVTGEDSLLETKQYPNQCAVNLYAAMQRSSINMKSFHGQLSWQKNKPKYAIRAQEVANWLASATNPINASRTEKLGGKDVFEKVGGRTGVIFFQNYWGAGNQGDHIDLWNGSRLSHFRSLAQIYLRIGSFGLGSDYRDAEAVWFWPVI